ncbi:hypothetical protein, partial [Mesorhizobium sp. M6A.T.Ce.TU.002.03.1.1]|uniref:hypothetical protein n=1 Tax=Mesorhizobium sp. M6A.T.Ce.TU.002.03.1.1 TaxID=2496782 RepID=UPI0019D29266
MRAVLLLMAFQSIDDRYVTPEFAEGWQQLHVARNRSVGKQRCRPWIIRCSDQADIDVLPVERIA